MAYIQTQGPTVILSATGQSSINTTGSTSYTGDWYQIHPNIGRLTFQCYLACSASGGATAATTVLIEVSNSTAYGPASTAATTDAVPLAFVLTNNSTNYVTAGGVLSSAWGGPNGQWGFVRANMVGLTTSTGGTTGVGPTVNVIVNAGPIGKF